MTEDEAEAGSRLAQELTAGDGEGTASETAEAAEAAEAAGEGPDTKESAPDDVDDHDEKTPDNEEPPDDEPPDDEQSPDDEETTAPDLPPSWTRAVAFGVVRAAVVLIGAAVAYQAVVPVSHVARSRLAHLVVTKPGLAAYDAAKPSSAEQQASQLGLAALQTAATKSPNQSGAYSTQWVPAQASGAGLVALLFPDASQATTGFSQLVKAQLGPSTYSSDGLKRLSTFTVAAVPGATAAVYGTSKPAGQPGLAVVAYRYQRVVVLDEVFNTGPTQTDASALANNEYVHLQQILPSFSLKYVTHPFVATVLWAAGSVGVAAIAAFGPAGWRLARRRRQRRRAAELASRVVVGGQVIHKRRL